MTATLQDTSQRLARVALYAALLTAPFVVGSQLPEYRHAFVSCLEAVVIGGGLLAFALRYAARSHRRCATWRDLAWMAHCASLGIATWVYNTGVGRPRYPRNYLGDVGFSAAFTILLVLCADRFGRKFTRRDHTLWVATLVSILAAHGWFLFRPFQSIQPPPPLPAAINFYVYSIIAAAVTAFMLHVSARTACLYENLYAHSFLVFAAADFSARYYAILTVRVSVNWAESGYAAGLAGMFLVAVEATAFANPVSSRTAKFAGWSSVRALLGLFVFTANVILLVGAFALKVFAIKDTFDLSVVLLLVIGAWSTANAIAAFMSHKLWKIASLLPDPQAVATYASDTQSLRVPSINTRINVAEFDNMIGVHNALAEELNRLSEALVEQSRRAALGNLATQVAHDIRSPLAALSMLQGDLSRLPEETRTLMRGAINRIQDIAYDLLSQNREQGTSQASLDEEQPTPVLMSSLIATVVSEKRTQARARLDVLVEGHLDLHSYGLFVRVKAADLKRALSNLLNNAVEALSQRGAVSVRVAERDGMVCVTVQDTGRGIPPDVLSRLGQRGTTAGKQEGNGLGVYGVQCFAQDNGGSLHIESKLGQGTQVSLRIPKATAPEWFLRHIDLTDVRTVLVCDDDVSIHHLWDERFAHEASETEILHASNFSELRTHGRRLQGRSDVLYLIDYEILGGAENGLEVIEKLQLARRAILVTSRFEEQSVVQGCLARGVKLIPKPVAAAVPILSAQGSRGDPDDTTVLIDNDFLVRLAWQHAARRVGRTLNVFSEPAEFFAHADRFAEQTPIYIDSELDEGVKGEEVARDLHARGFRRLIVASGHSAKNFMHLPWLHAVVGKEPPF